MLKGAPGSLQKIYRRFNLSLERYSPEEVFTQASKGLCDLVWKNGIFLALTIAHLIKWSAAINPDHVPTLKEVDDMCDKLVDTGVEIGYETLTGKPLTRARATVKRTVCQGREWYVASLEECKTKTGFVLELETAKNDLQLVWDMTCDFWTSIEKGCDVGAMKQAQSIFGTRGTLKGSLIEGATCPLKRGVPVLEEGRQACVDTVKGQAQRRNFDKMHYGRLTKVPESKGSNQGQQIESGMVHPSPNKPEGNHLKRQYNDARARHEKALMSKKASDGPHATSSKTNAEVLAAHRAWLSSLMWRPKHSEDAEQYIMHSGQVIMFAHSEDFLVLEHNVKGQTALWVGGRSLPKGTLLVVRMERLAQRLADSWKVKHNFGTGEFSPTFVDAGSDNSGTYVDKTFNSLEIFEGYSPCTGKPLWFCANHCNEGLWGANIALYVHYAENDRAFKAGDVHYVTWIVTREIQPGEELCYVYEAVDHMYPVLHDERHESLHNKDGSRTEEWERVLAARCQLKRGDPLPRVKHRNEAEIKSAEGVYNDKFSKVVTAARAKEKHEQTWKGGGETKEGLGEAIDLLAAQIKKLEFARRTALTEVQVKDIGNELARELEECRYGSHGLQSASVHLTALSEPPAEQAPPPPEPLEDAEEVTQDEFMMFNVGQARSLESHLVEQFMLDASACTSFEVAAAAATEETAAQTAAKRDAATQENGVEGPH